MSRERNKYNSFRIKELDGGLNLENSPNEIDNKQCLECENFNFNGNKLVNAKTGELYHTGTGNIKGLNILFGDVYHTEQGTTLIYENGSRINTNIKGFKITSPLDNNLYTIELTAGDLITENYSYLSDADATIDEIQTGLTNSINASSNYEAYQQYIWNGTTTELVVLIKRINNVFNSFNYSLPGSVIVSNDSMVLGDNDYCIIKKYDDRLFILNTNTGGLYIVDDGFIRLQNINSYIFEIWNGKLFYAIGNNIYFSKTSSATDPFLLLDFTGYDGGVQQLGEGGNITGFTVSENGIYAIKEDEIYYSNSIQDDGSTFGFVFNKITNNGSINNNVIQKVDQEVLYNDGIIQKVRRIGYEQNLTTLRDTSISIIIDDLFIQNPISQPYATASYKYPNYKIFLRSSELLTYNDLCFVYNVDRKSWATQPKNCQLADYGYYAYGDKIYKDDTIFNSSGTFLSKEYDLGDALDRKRIDGIEIYGKLEDGVTLYLDIYTDGVLRVTKTITTSSLDYFKKRYDLWYEGRYLQFGIRYSGTGYLEINEVNLGYKVLKSKKYN